MKKKIFGKKLKRDTNERKGLFKSLISELVLREQIKTTAPKAKAIRSEVEKLVTKLKKVDLEKSKLFQGSLSYEVFTKLRDNVAPRFINRNGGYTRVIKIAPRVRDNADMVVLEWTEKNNKPSEIKPEEVKSKKAEVNSKEKTEIKEDKVKKEKVSPKKKKEIKK